MTHAASQPSPPAPPVPAPTRPRRWGRRLLALLAAGLAAAAWFAPQIVAETSLKQQVPKLLFPGYPGAIEVGSASLGWLQPVVVRNLVARDTEGETLLDIKEFSTSLPLWQLATNPSQLGRLQLREPVVSLAFRDGGSNLEDVLAKYLRRPGTTPSFDLEIIDGSIDLQHSAASLKSTVAPVSGVLQSRRGTVEDLELAIGTVPSADEASLEPATDWLAFRYGSQPTQEGVAMLPGSRQIRLKAEGWTLDRLRPALARWQADAELSGTLDADARLQISFADDPVDWTERTWSWDGRVTLASLELAGVPALGSDRVTLGPTSLSGRLAAQQGRLAMDRFKLQSDVGELTATGDVSMSLLAASPAAALRSVLGEQDYDIQGHVDLQKLAALLPNTLRVREETEITQGRVNVTLASEVVDGTRTWTSQAGIDQLAARHRGDDIVWREPLRLDLKAHQESGAITVDRLTCQSDFFKLTGQGTLTDANFTASGDLARLEENLDRFVDLGLEKLSGTIAARGQIQRADDDQVSLSAVVHLDQFQWNVSRQTAWQEPRLDVTLKATAIPDADSRLKRIESGELKLTSGPDSLVSTLQGPVDLDQESAQWPVAMSLQGELHTWQNRVRPFLDFKDWQAAGTAKIDATVMAEPGQFEVRELTGHVSSLDLRHPDWWIKEPQVKFETAGVWSAERSEWTAPRTTVSGTAISCRVDDLRVDLDRGTLQRITGDAAFRGDLDKLSRWKNQALERPAYHFIGTFEGQTQIVENGSIVSLDFDTTVQKLVVANLQTLPNQQLHWVALWREPELRLAGKGSYDLAADRIQMDNASIQGEGLKVHARGSLMEPAASQRIDLKGDLACDWDALSQRMGDSLRQMVQVRGRQQRPFAIHGSLAARPGELPGNPDGKRGAVDLSGHAGIGWDSATLEGLAVGPADVSARLENGLCQFAPIETTIAGGTLRLTPQIRLDPTPAVVVLPPGKVLDRVQLSSEICQNWLKFVAPMLADATQIDGQFSLDIAGAALPLELPGTGDLRGTLGIHQGRVRPGQSALQILGLYEQIQAIITRKPAGGAPRDRVWMHMPEQAIPFHLARGRVHHQAVTFVIGDGTLQSSGSVGLDESLDLVLSVPILDEWARDQKLLSGLKGKTLKIPVRGTLARPQFDSRVLTELATQIGGTALEGALENAIDDLFKKNLNKLLPGKK